MAKTRLYRFTYDFNKLVFARHTHVYTMSKNGKIKANIERDKNNGLDVKSVGQYFYDKTNNSAELISTKEDYSAHLAHFFKCVNKKMKDIVNCHQMVLGISDIATSILTEIEKMPNNE